MSEDRVTGPPEPPAELAVSERHIWWKQFRTFVVAVIIALGVMLAVVAASNGVFHR